MPHTHTGGVRHNAAMRAVRNTREGDVRVVEYSGPERDGVRVRVRAASICGTDLELIRIGELPFVLGHEFAGVLDDGTAVAVQPLVFCGTCERCLAGEGQQCLTALSTGYGLGTDGGMCDETFVDPSTIVPLPAGVDPADASLVEPIAVALHAAHRVAVEAGQRVAVVGAGSIGLLCGAVARHLGADVSIVTRHPAQAAAAEALGLRVGPAGEHDVVFEAAGSQSAFDSAVDLSRRGGSIALVSTSWQPIDVSFVGAQVKETSLVPAIVYGHHGGERETDAAAAILAAHPEIAPAVVSHRFGLDGAAEAFRTATDRAAGAIKVVLQP